MTDVRGKVLALCALAGDAGAEGLGVLPDYYLTSYDVYYDEDLDILSSPSVRASPVYPTELKGRELCPY